jgi:predicted 2-oxoglutarate/Fe(II)-dependent dioxygenase YbiX
VAELGLGFPLLSDTQGQVSHALGLEPGGQPVTVLLDSNLRLFARVGPAEVADHSGEIAQHLRALGTTERRNEIDAQAPVLLLPRVLPPDVCAAVIRLWEREPHLENLVSSDKAADNVAAEDYKVREDIFLKEGQAETTQVLALLERRLLPEIRRIFHFEVTRIEGIRVGCYAAERGGMFRRHRDNNSRTTAHRRFAMSLNLNAGEFEGGGVRFPEYGQQVYQPPTGAALVFSCGLLHEALPVTRGRRMGMFTFFYGEADEQLRLRLEAERNRQAKAGAT